MRQIKTINEQWYFSKDAAQVPKEITAEWKTANLLHTPAEWKTANLSYAPVEWELVNLPHTWNGVDGQDGGNDYYRGTCYYAKVLPGELFAGYEASYLQFDGVNSSAVIYWNGINLTTHHGGYSTFRVPLHEIKEENLLVVAADNSPNDFVYPQNADFTFYGGIYRDVKIVNVPRVHFDLEYLGTPGIKVTPVVKGECAEVEIEAFVQMPKVAGQSDYKVRFTVMEQGSEAICTQKSIEEQELEAISTQKNVEEQELEVISAQKNVEERESGTISVQKNVQEQAFAEEQGEIFSEQIIYEKTECVIRQNNHENTSVKIDFTIKNPHLWDGLKAPYLYTVRAELLLDEIVLDEISTRFGCRSFYIDAKEGFILNGRPYPLRGVSRHQDRPVIGNALTFAHHKEDLDLILEMGANTIRLAHYQHAQEFYDMCDEKGLILWAEIPYITTHMPNGQENTVNQMTELIVQNYNHPSIVTWGVSNEITCGGARDKGMLENHRVLNALVHRLDPTRPTTMAVITMCDMDEEIVHMTDIVSYNHYFGWYGGNVNMYGKWFDRFHEKYPDKAIGISEYGCEALNWHTLKPTQGDYTEEYQAYYHEELIKTIAKRPYLWATHVWNMFDFAADARAEGGENGMNHKGLVTFDRKYKKDAFYAYKAWLSDKPFVHIAGKRYVDRVESVTKVTVYTNQPEVEVIVNGVSAGKQKRGEFPFFYFEVKNEGESILTAKAGDCTDESRIRKVETFNEDYRMKEEGDVINWFEITTPAGYYSINDTIGDIGSSLRGKITILLMIRSVLKKKKSTKKVDVVKENTAKNSVRRSDAQRNDSKKRDVGDDGTAKNKSDGGIKFNKDMLELIGGFTVKRALSMVGMLGIDSLEKEEILEINRKLNKIRKR